MSSTSKGKISHTLHAISLIPLIFSGIAIILFGSHWITQIMYEQVEQELTNIAQSTVMLFDTAYPGDYELADIGGGALRLHKGGQDITEEYTLVDRIREDTGIEVSLFYQDTRILTTIHTSGKRFVGSGAPSQVMAEVFETGEAHFYNNTLINNAFYFAYYTPLHNSDGSIIGMICVGKPCKNIENAVRDAVYPLVFLVFIAMLISIVLLFFYTRNIVQVLMKIQTFLTQVSTGNTNTSLDPTVLRRNDELGDIGRCAVSMQNSIRTLIEQDALTGLYNRRSVERKLKQIIDKSAKQEGTFCVAIGDIDYFKKINDTYGHEAGDMVLKEVSSILREHMANRGFVARWGGEEFLLAFDQLDIHATQDSLKSLLERIRNTEYVYNGQIIHITMTFGVAGEETEDITSLLRKADANLYTGKENGRNQIVI